MAIAPRERRAATQGIWLGSRRFRYSRMMMMRRCDVVTVTGALGRERCQQFARRRHRG
jgi:hypothetical protein